ncbi:MAG: cobalamin-binding protein [Pseudomonadota bacterium]
MNLSHSAACHLTGILLLWLLPSIGLPAAVKVTDDTGTRVSLSQPADRIISLAPHITELLFAAGAADAIVAVAEFSDYPAAAALLPRIGGGSGIDLEAVIALQPDLVIAWGSGNPAGQVARLRQLGIPVFVSEPRVLADIPASLRRFGQLAGTELAANAAADRFNLRHRQLLQRNSGKSTVSVFYQIWDRPLMTVNDAHLISDVIRLCGGSNVFADLSGLASPVGLEAVLQRDPQVIIAGSDSTDAADLMAYWQRWPEMAAVRQGYVYSIPRELLVRHTPRILAGAERLCGLLDSVRQER